MSETAVTVLEMVNKILTRMREVNVGTINETDQSSAVLRLINDAKREVEDSFDWLALQETIAVATSSDTTTYAVATSDVFTNQRSRILDIYNTTKVVTTIQTSGTDDPVTTVSTSREDTRLNPDPFNYLRRLHQNVDAVPSNSPSRFGVSGVDATQTLQILLYPKPDVDTDVSSGTEGTSDYSRTQTSTVYNLDVEVVNPQDDLNADNQYTKVPWYPVYLRALALAVRERGEDEGEQYSEIQQAYQLSIGDAMAYEQRHKWQAEGGGDWMVLGDY